MNESKLIRRHKDRRDDGKGIRRFIAGHRFRFSADASKKEVEQRIVRLEQLWDENEAFCRKIGRSVEWTDMALWAGNHIRLGELRIPFPPIDEILPSFGDSPIHCEIEGVINHYLDDTGAYDYPSDVDGLTWDEAVKFYDLLVEWFPSVNWTFPEAHRVEMVRSRESSSRWNLEYLAAAKRLPPPDPKTPLITGTLHEALLAYEKVRDKGFFYPDGSYNGSGHHMVGMVRDFRVRYSDFPLAELDFTRCQTVLIDYWRNRPPRRKKGQEHLPMAKKSCGNNLGELKRFLESLHLSTEFGWRKFEDFSSLNFEIKDLPTDRKSISRMPIGTFSLEDLMLLYKYALPSERLPLVWCLNCAHGAAEFGRVEWEDIFLHQEHLWKAQGLKLETDNQDSWCGLLRPKTDVLGWWWLWPETVTLIEWWRAKLASTLNRTLEQTERVVLTDKGTPEYRDSSRNAQSGFASRFTRLLERIEDNEGQDAILKRPFGTLRNQLSDWLGGDEAKAVVASVALCHGIPHKGDKLLYKHYSNRPWAALFRAQRDYREHLRPMFEAMPDVLAVYDPIGDKVEQMWKSGERNIDKIAEALSKSPATVNRRLKERELKKFIVGRPKKVR